MKRENDWLSEPAYAEEGFIDYPFRGRTYKLWHGRVGKGDRPPLLVLHGGPGGNHHNLVAFQALGDRRAVIFYDQLGCGNSERPDDPSLWVAERYFDEVANIIDDYELKGLGDQPSYEEACLEFVKRYVTHTWPLPEAMEKLIAARNRQVHDVMVASGSELNVPGNLKSVDVTDRLAGLDLPVLITCGASDLCTPEYTRWQSGFARDGRVFIIPESAHMTPIDNPGELIGRQRQFLEEVEGASP